MSQVLEKDFTIERFVKGGVEWVAQYASDGEIYKTYPTGEVAETDPLANQKETAGEVLFDLTAGILED